MFYKKLQLVPIAISASLFLFSLIIFTQTTTVPAQTENAYFLGVHGYVCIWKNEDLVQCSNNLITNAGKNMTRDLLTYFNTTPVQTRLNGTLYIALAVNGTADAGAT